MMTHEKADVVEQARLNAIGMPQPETGQPVQPFQSGRPPGERQDGPGVAPYRRDRDDAVPVGSTAARRSGIRGALLTRDEPGAGHRGEPATFATGAATGSGSGAGGGGTGMIEEPDPDSAGGGGRERGFAASRVGRHRFGDGRKHGGC